MAAGEGKISKIKAHPIELARLGRSFGAAQTNFVLQEDKLECRSYKMQY